MKMNEMQLYSAINEFIDREIMPLGATFHEIPKQFLFAFGVGTIKRKIHVLVRNYLNKPEIKMLELKDEDGNIDIETMYESAVDAMEMFKQVDLYGFTFKLSDLQNLYGIMQKYA